MPVVEAGAFAPLVESFAAGSGDEGRWLRAVREQALAAFQRRGLPTTDDEAWRHTNLGAIARHAFGRAGGMSSTAVNAASPLRLDVSGSEVLVVNGRPHTTPPASPPAGVEIVTLREALRDESLHGVLGGTAEDTQSAFTALNTALFEDGILVRLAPGAVLEAPIHLLHLSEPGHLTAAFPRVLVLAGAGSQGTIVETFAGPDGVTYFTNAVTEITLGEGAVLSHCRVQQEGTAGLHIASVDVRQERGSRFTSHSIALGAHLARVDINVLLAGNGADCALDGLFLGKADGQLLDHHTRIDHARPYCTSQEHYRGILGGKARGVFVGTIVVQKDAQKTRAHQTNRNLLLSKDALVQSTPQLQIYADDVQCKHGSTTGQLDATALFYLRSRGIGEEAARDLLTYAFASDVLGRIPVPELRARLLESLGVSLPGIANDTRGAA